METSVFFPTTVLASILVGAVLNLDKQAFGPFMVGRPLVVGMIIGLIAGELRFGTWMGLSAELLWLAALPLGGQLTPHAGLAVTAALTAWLGSGFAPAGGAYQTEAGLVISFLTLPFWARAFTVIDRITRRLALPQVARARADLEAGREPRLFRRNLNGLWTTLGCSLAALAAAVTVNGFLLRAVMRLAPETVLLNLGALFTFIPFLGLLGLAVFLDFKAVNFYIYGLLASLLALSAVL